MISKRAGTVMAGAVLVVVGLTALRGGRAAVEAASNDAVTAGEFVVEPPTLINLGFEWLIDGDDNRNAGNTWSTRCAARSAMRRPPQLGQNPRPLHENATR